MFWWKEAILVVTFYLLYSWSRNQFGSARLETGGTPEHAFNNAIMVVRIEKAVGLFHEAAIQSWFTGSTAVMQFWNTYYGLAHFVVTIAVFVVLFFKRPDVFPIWRNTILVTTGLAIIGFSMFPLMPPRLLDAPCPEVTHTAEGVEVTNYGGACIPSSERPDTMTISSSRVPPGTLKCEKGPFGFVDSLECFGGPWSFDNDTIKSLSNQYAAMPSLHIGWATWCAFAMWPLHPPPALAVRDAAVPVADAHLHHRHGQPLLARRHRWTADARGRFRPRLGAAHLEPEPPGPPFRALRSGVGAAGARPDRRACRPRPESLPAVRTSTVLQ